MKVPLKSVVLTTIALLYLCFFLMSSFFAEIHKHHTCDDIHCPVCTVLNTIKKGSGSIKNHFAAVFKFILNFGVYFFIMPFFAFLTDSLPVSLKVRNNR